MICAACLALGRPLTERTKIWNDGVLVWQPPVAGAAITIANGQALCLDHFRELSDWQNEVHGHLSLLALLDVLAPDQPPEQ